MPGTIMVEMKVDGERNNPLCYMVWEMNLVSGTTTLAVVCTDRLQAEKYSRRIRKFHKEFDRRVRMHIEEREMNHAFALTMMQSIGLPLETTPGKEPTKRKVPRMDRFFSHVIRDAVKTEGTFDPEAIMVYFEGSLYEGEYKEIEDFLNWVHKGGRTFGHNINEVYQAYLEEVESHD